MDDQQNRGFDKNLGSSSRVMRSIYWSAPVTIALMAAALSTCWDYWLPGVYMDSVNPDYLIVNAINDIRSLYGWVLPGTMVFGIFPTIIQIYHGALPFYVGLPTYTLFGTGLAGIRLTNSFFALLVISSAFIALKTLRVRPIVIALILTCLSLDPAFIFSFRTQFYITLLPIIFVFLSVALNAKSKFRDDDRLRVWSGMASGISFYGYFIYLFLAPALFMQSLITSKNKVRSSLAWIFGFVIGSSFYVLGYALIFHAVGGVAEFRSFLAQNLTSLGVAQPPMSVIESIANIRSMLVGTILDFGPSVMMFHTFVANSFPHFKIITLAIIPTIYSVLSLFRARRHVPILTIFGLLGGLCLLFFIFGKRLWFHHAIPSLPLMYIGLALTTEACLVACNRFNGLRIGGASLACVLLGFLLVTNLLDRHAVFVELEKTGGVGLASDAIVHFAEDNISQASPTKAFFPDWGIFMPFEMITNGATAVTTDFSADDAIRTLCAGQDVLLGTIDGKSSRQIDFWKTAVDWGEPVIRTYDQKDGTPVMTAVRWSAVASHQASCH